MKNVPTWDELFKDEINRHGGIEPHVHDMTKLMKQEFKMNKLKVWDVGCGAGRHTVFFARYGFDTYATDISENGINLTKEWLQKENVTAKLKLSKLSEYPWKNIKFHGIIAWNVLQHATIKEFSKNLEILKDSLLPGGFILLSLLTTTSQDCGMGKKIEKNTFEHTEGIEIGVVHHYFDKEEMLNFFKGWEFKIFIERVDNIDIAVFKRLPFPHRNAHFIVCAQKIKH